jgi:hypothetical protein
MLPHMLAYNVRCGRCGVCYDEARDRNRRQHHALPGPTTLCARMLASHFFFFFLRPCPWMQQTLATSATVRHERCRSSSCLTVSPRGLAQSAPCVNTAHRSFAEVAQRPCSNYKCVCLRYIPPSRSPLLQGLIVKFPRRGKFPGLVVFIRSI